MLGLFYYICLMEDKNNKRISLLDEDVVNDNLENLAKFNIAIQIRNDEEFGNAYKKVPIIKKYEFEFSFPIWIIAMIIGLGISMLIIKIVSH